MQKDTAATYDKRNMKIQTKTYICMCVCDSNVIFLLCTSSTAQGGGGSFKNRKPIGEIDCCESPMTEQKHWWIELFNCV